MMSPVRLSRLKRVFLGSPLPTAQSRHERLAKTTALAVFASDALSSVAYATEEILLVLVLAGTAALSYSLPISIAIAVLITIVVSSYRQTIRAYPQGGGAVSATPAGARGRRALPVLESVRLGLHRADRRRGGLRRRARVQAAGGAQRADRADRARRDPDRALHGHHLPRLRLRHRAAPRGDGGLAARAPRLRRRRVLLRDPGRHDADPPAGRQHVLRGLSAALLLPGARPLHPAPVRDAGRPARVIERHPDPERSRRAAAGDLRRRHPRADPALRGRRLPLVHALAGEHGAAVAAPEGRGLAVALVAQRGRRHRDGAGDDHDRRHEVHARRVDRRPADPIPGRRVRHRAPPLRRGRGPALAGRVLAAAADDQHRPGPGRRHPSWRHQGDPVRADPVTQRQGGLRGDRSRADPPAGREVGQVRHGRAADRADVALSVAAGPADQVRRPSTEPGREPRRHDRAAGVHPGQVVAARSAQPDRVPHQGRDALPQERHRHRRALPPASLSRSTGAGGRATLWYTRNPRDHSMKIVLAPDGPLDARGTLARYHLWGEDPTNRIGDDVFRRVLRHEGRLVPYEVRWSGPVEDVRIIIRAPGRDAAAGTAIVGEVRRLLGLDLDLAGFYRMAKGDSALAALIEPLYGLRPTLSPTPFEMLVGSITAQQVNLSFAFACRARLVRRFGTPVKIGGETVWAFPAPARLARASVREMRALKYSTRKAE